MESKHLIVQILNEHIPRGRTFPGPQRTVLKRSSPNSLKSQKEAQNDNGELMIPSSQMTYMLLFQIRLLKDSGQEPMGEKSE